MATTTPIHFTGDPEADALLGESPLALLIGFALDQQVTVQKAFSCPLSCAAARPSRRGAIAAMDPAELEEVFRERPAIHRFPANMARRTQELCAASRASTAATPPRGLDGAARRRRSRARRSRCPASAR